MIKRIQKTGMFAVVLVLLAVQTLFAQQVVTNTSNANIDGSLLRAIERAYQAGGNQTVTFNINTTLLPVVIDNVNITLNASGSLNSLTIDGTSQPGYVSGTPAVLLRGNGGNVGITVDGLNNLTIKGFIFQGFNIGYLQNRGRDNRIETCWFGVSNTGLSVSSPGISTYGILVGQENGGPATTLSVGSRSDFTAATRNVVSGCGTGGIKFQNAGPNSYIGNTFVGTDVTGTVAIPNGGTVSTPAPEIQHGITITATPSITVKNNLISGNRSGGIAFFGASGGSVITGNKIGTDVTGTQPLGNGTFGIRAMGSGSHTIGGPDAADRNIVSANGNSVYDHEANTKNNEKFDWYNSCGIYLFNSAGNTVMNNYIGVDVTGTKITVNTDYDMGNFYTGVKIDGWEPNSNNKIINNVVGGNGFRSGIAARADRIRDPLDGHGLIIKDASTTNTLITGNRIGVGANGTAPVGNMQDGISVQGAVGTIIGGSRPEDRNIIGNNTWGIYVASNYYNSQARNTRIIGNYIGTDESGSIAIGNGTRTGLPTGGGIGIIHFSQNTTVGGLTPAERNIVSGNREGIYIAGNSPASNANGTLGNNDLGLGASGTKVYGNYVGYAADGATVLGNLGSGITVSQAAKNNEIGGTSAASGNIVTGAGLNAVLSDSANTNTFSNNIITGSLQNGIFFRKSALSTISANTITGNRQNGISLTMQSTGNTIQANTIGDLAAPGKGNNGDGIRFENSSNNLVGGSQASLGNIIANNTGNGINLASISDNVAIHRNQIACNGGRGIVLADGSNALYPAPVFKGNNASIIVEGQPGSYIEVYTQDGCKDCSSGSSSGLQGKTFVTSGPSPLSFTPSNGTFYTATASSQSSASANPHRTSEFSGCYNFCTPPTVNIPVKGDTVCSPTDGTVTVSGAQAISYQAYINNQPVGTPKSGPGTVQLTIPFASLAQGTTEVTVRATPAPGCTPVPLQTKAFILINPPVDTGLVIIGDTVCAGNDAIVRILKSQNISYQAFIGNTPVGLPATGPDTVSLTVPAASLVQRTTTVSVRGTPFGRGCTATSLARTATVIRNTPPRLDADVFTDSAICSGSVTTVRVNPAEAGKTYQVFDETGAAAGPAVTALADGPLTLPVTKALAVGDHILTVRAGVAGCAGLFELNEKANVKVNKGISGSLSLTHNAPVCVGSRATITIQNSESGIVYRAYDNVTNQPVSDEFTGTGKPLPVQLYQLPPDTHIVYFKARVTGCGEIRLGNTATIIVNTDVNKNLTATAPDSVCLNQTVTVSIQNSEKAKNYQVFEGTKAVSASLPGTGTLLQIPVNGLAAGPHIFRIQVTVAGCKTDTLTQRPSTYVNSVPDSTLKVGTNGPVCAGNRAVFFILKSEKGKKYQIFHNSTSVSLIAAGNGDTLRIPLNNLLPGTYVLTARATAAGCTGSVNLADKATIVVNTFPDTDLNAFANGPVCLNNEGTVTVEKPEAGKYYTVFYKGRAISDPATAPANAAILQIKIRTLGIPEGTYELAVGTSVPGCTPDTLVKRPLITINEIADPDLPVSAVSSPICVGTDGEVRIDRIQKGVSYQAFLGNDTLSEGLSGNDTSLILPLRAAKLKTGWNLITVKATSKGCSSQNLSDSAGIKVNPEPKLDLAISVSPDVICAGGESRLTISISEKDVKYMAVVGTKPVSDAVTGTGGSIDLLLNKLELGDNNVRVQATAGGCADKMLDSAVTVRVNKGPEIDYDVSGSEVCKGQAGTVTISGSEPDAFYRAYLKSANTPISDSIKGTGDKITLQLFPSNNLTDTIIIKASVSGCGLVRLDQEAILITNDIELTRKLSTRGSTICKEALSATATVLKALKGKDFEARIGSKLIGTQKGTGSDLVFTVSSADLPDEINNVTFTALLQGCGPVVLDSVAAIIVNDINASRDLPVRGSDICVGDASGTATVIGAKNGVSYIPTVNGVTLPPLTGTGADLTFTIPVANLNMGANTVSFEAHVQGCSTIVLNNKAVINRNDNTTSKGLSVKGSTVCVSEQAATATILGAKAGITYQAYVGNSPVSSPLTADGSDLVLSIPVTNLSSGNNIISFLATVAGCDPVRLDSTAIVTVLGDRFAINGNTLKCYDTEGEYSISPVSGISRYDWTVPAGAVILTGQGTNRITVKFGSVSGTVTVTPVGNIGACNAVSGILDVEVAPAYNDTISIIGREMVCINDIDRVYADSLGVTGVDSIAWTLSSGISMVDTLYKKSVFKHFNVKYSVADTQMIIARPHIRCSDTFGKADTLFVKVLNYPVANAGIYPVIENDLSSPVVLDGTGSTENQQPFMDSVSYNWTTDDPEAIVSNHSVIKGASFVPNQEKTIVTLTVSNRNGLCPVSDTALVTVITELQIPNIFTPNGDGVHDKWEIKNLHKLYPNCVVEVFNKWGSFIYRSNGYGDPWDGTRNGEELPVATYYYMIDLKNGTKPKVASVTIIR